MLGAICGDIVGARFEFKPIRSKDFRFWPRDAWFTDDTVCTIGIGRALMGNLPIAETLQKTTRDYLYAGYGGLFANWVMAPTPRPYNSFGNGSAMRVSAAAWIARDLGHAIDLAAQTAKVTHNHPEGIKGAVAVTIAIRMAMEGWSKAEIKDVIERYCGYDLNRSLASLQKDYQFNETCQGSVPEAIICFLESTDFEDALRNVVSIGGDSDTQGAMVGAIAEAYFGGVPAKWREEVRDTLSEDLRDTLDTFLAIYVDGKPRPEKSDLTSLFAASH